MSEDLKINFELYRVFYETAKCGNITQAAARLYLTQPSVSKHIHTLEQALGCTLFQRSRSGVELTAEGQVLYRKLEPACRLIFTAEQELRALNSLEQGSVFISSTEMSFMAYVLPALVRFQDEHPGVKVRFSNALNDEMIRLLENGLIDIAILHEPFHKEDFMELRSIERMEEWLVAGAKYAHLAQGVRTPAEVLEYPFISMPEGSSNMEYLRRFFAAQGLSFDPDICLTTMELTIRALESGLGLSILPKRIAQPLLDAGRLFRIRLTTPLPPRVASIITNRHFPPSIAASAFINHMLERDDS